MRQPWLRARPGTLADGEGSCELSLSSAEAELIAMVKCSAELLGVRSMLRDLGVETSGVVYADSSAALAIAKRKGAGKLRHINVSSLRVQECQDRIWSIGKS